MISIGAAPEARFEAEDDDDDDSGTMASLLTSEPYVTSSPSIVLAPPIAAPVAV